jgi:hypothetical protein
MTPLETLTLEIDAFERHLGRRRFLRAVSLVGAASGALGTRLFAAGRPATSVSAAAAAAAGTGRPAYDRAFLAAVARTLISADALRATRIDVLANVDHLLARASATHRAAILRALAWARRLSFMYGGDRFALDTRESRFIVIRRLGRLVASLCLLAFWGDERALGLLHA